MSEKLALLTDHTLDIAFHFEVRVAEDGGVGNFISVEGLGRTVEPYEYTEGGRNDNVHALVGQAKLGELTLKWGWMNLSWLYDWAMLVDVGRSFRKDLIISQLDRGGQPLRVYVVTGAWPISWTGANLDAGNSEIPIEELKLRYDRLRLAVTPPSRPRS